MNCLKHIGIWMNAYFLRLNETKTKILVIVLPFIQRQIHIRRIFVGKRTSSGISAAFLANCGHLHLLKTLSQCGEMRKDDGLRPNHQKR